MSTQFEVGKSYSFSNFFMWDGTDTICKVVAKDETRKTITIVEEYEAMQVEIPYKKMIDRYGNTFEVSRYYGDHIYSSNESNKECK